MFDAALMPLSQRMLEPLARRVAANGATADGITVIGFVIGVLALPALAFGYWWIALLLILLNRLFDGLDGAVARATEPTDRGAYMDIALDFVFYALVPLGFAFADPEMNALPAAVLIASFIGTGSSFLAYAAIAGKRGVTAAAFPRKGIYYLGGLTEGFETILVMVLMCLLPANFATIAYVFAAACAVTTVLRWWQGWLAFGTD